MYGAVSKFGVVSDSGVNSEVEKGWVTTAGAEGSEVSSLGKVGGRVGERSGVSAGITAASGVDRVRPEFIQEARSGLGGKVPGGSEVTSRVDAVSGISPGAESGVTGGPGGSGEAEGAGEGAGGAVLAVVGRCSRRSGHGFLREPVSPRILGAGEEWPGLQVVVVVRVDPGLPAVGVPLGRAPPEGVSHVWEGS